MTKRNYGFAGALLLSMGLAVNAAGCFVDYLNDCSYNITLQCFYGNAGGGGGGTGGTGGAPPECVPSETNKEVEDECGVFVASDPNVGSDGNGKGTQAEPYLTLKKAIAKAQEEGKPLYVCGDEGTPFKEAILATGELTIYGGFGCVEKWLYDPKKRSGWTADSDTVPLRVAPEGKVTVTNFSLTAQDGLMEGGSSIGVIVGLGADLTLEACDVKAGDGKAGVSPAKPSGSAQQGGNGDKGADGCVDTMVKPGGAAGANSCDEMSYNGGVGGTGTTTDGGPGADGFPQPGTPPDDGKGGIGQSGVGTCANGVKGGNGQAGTPGDGGTGIGTLSEDGYEGVSGTPGKTKGSPGQGGGGGGGAKICQPGGPNNTFAGPGGGGGGAGGCGGIAGPGGAGGGASIGILSFGAVVTLTACTVTSGKGGTGGKGADGQSGGLGGTSGLAGTNNTDPEAKACNGGDGGKGGNGGPGGGGLGGPSIAIAFQGTAPKVDDSTLTAGEGGKGGEAGDMNPLPTAQGAPGLACKTLDVEAGVSSCMP